MPTGYTAELDDHPELTTAKWITEKLARNFGLLYHLRDGPYNLSADEIAETIAKDDGTKYYKENLEKIMKAFDRLNDDPDAFLEKEYKAEVRCLKKYNKQSQESADITKQRHEQVESELITLRDGTDDEITRNIAKFGLKQLEVVKSDREPYISKIPTFETFKENKLSKLDRDMEYYLDKIKACEKAHRDRVLAYQTLRSEVERILGVRPLESTVRNDNE